MSLKMPDADKDYVKTDKDGQVAAFWVDNLQYSTFGKFIIYRLLHNRDVKIVITGKGKSTGTGKTTLAILLSWWINAVRNDLFDMSKEWKAEDYAFMDVWDYLKKYQEADKGDALITDELEYLADRRRHQTHENVRFSQAWQVLRWKNVITIGTCPHLSDIDKRIPESTDIWINVTQTGRANIYYLLMDDFKWNMIFKRTKMFGYRESILWNDISDTEDYQWLQNQKEEIGVPGLGDKENQVSKEDLDKLEREVKQSITANIIEYVEENGLKGTFTQADIGDIVGYSQQNVAKIKRQRVES